MKKIYICGIASSGKGLLRPLLDGHPKIITCPFQGFGMSFLYNPFIDWLNRTRLLSARIVINNENTKKITINNNGVDIETTIGEIISYLLKNEKMNILIDAILSGNIRAAPAESKQIFVDFKFSLNGFIKDIINELDRVKNFSNVEMLQDVIYSSFIRNWNNINNQYNSDTFFMEAAANGLEPIIAILNNNNERKILVVVRDPIAISYNNALKMKDKFELKEKKRLFGFYSNYKDHLYNKSFIDKVKNFRNKIEILKEQNKDVIYIVDFNDLVFNTKNTMDNIVEFLDIEKNDILYRATLNSKSVESKDIQFTGKINTDPYSDLPKSQIELLKYFYYGTDSKKNFISNTKIICEYLMWRFIQIVISKIK